MSCWDCVDCELNREYKAIAEQHGLRVVDYSRHHRFRSWLMKTLFPDVPWWYLFYYVLLGVVNGCFYSAVVRVFLQ